MFDFLKEKRLWIFLLTVVALGGVSLWYLKQDSDEGKIKDTLRALCQIASKADGEKNTTNLLKMRAIDNVFAPECRINFHYDLFNGTYKTEEVVSAWGRSRGLFRSCNVDLRDLSITVTPPDKAVAYFTGTLDAQLTDGSKISEVRDLECRLQKFENDWKITDISIRNVLEK